MDESSKKIGLDVIKQASEIIESRDKEIEELKGEIRQLKQQVKKLTMPDVSQQRELLIDFAKWEIKDPYYQKEVELVVDAYIKEKSINYG